MHITASTNIDKSLSEIHQPICYFPYHQVLILDRLVLTGKIIVDEVNLLAKRKCAVHFLDMKTLREVLTSPRMTGLKVLVIAELVTDNDTLYQGFQLLDDLACLAAITGRHHWMVYTGLREPLLLQAIIDKHPDALVLRDESMAIFRDSLRQLCHNMSSTLISPAVRSVLQACSVRKLSPRELMWILIQLDTVSLSAVARRLHRSEKTVSTHRRAVAERLGLHNSQAINRWLGQIQVSLGMNSQI